MEVLRRWLSSSHSRPTQRGRDSIYFCVDDDGDVKKRAGETEDGDGTDDDDDEEAAAHEHQPHDLQAANMVRPHHLRARMEHPSYPPRFPVPDDLVLWEVPFPAYNPKPFTDQTVLEQDSTVVPSGWADGKTPDRAAIERRGSYELQARREPFRFDAHGRPLNPPAGRVCDEQARKGAQPRGTRS